MAKRYIAALFFVFALPIAALAVEANIKLDDKLSSMKKQGHVGPVIYPHAKHEKLYKCGDCHPKIFSEKRAENNINMKANMDGKYCGSQNCHNSPKAFPLFECARCHTNVK